MTPAPSAAILVIGNEILSGRTQDINVQFIAGRLALRGIRLAEVRIVQDTEAAIVKAVRELGPQHSYVFSTGGIGPTHDDITADAMAKAFDAPLELNTEARQRLEDYYKGRNVALNESRLRMARIPKGAALIDNPVSAAPGFRIGNVYVMAGVPQIMQAMFLGLEHALAQTAPLHVCTIAGALREGDIALDLEAIQNHFPAVEIGSYPSLGTGSAPASLSLVLRAADPALLARAADQVLALARSFDSKAKIV